jgi:hypothetical protein
MAKDPARSLAQLRVVLRRWQQRAWVGVGLALFSLVGLAACWWWSAYGFWWLLSGLGVMSAVFEVLADLNAIHDLRQRIKNGTRDT